MRDWVLKRKEAYDTYCAGSRLSQLPYYKYQQESAKKQKKKCQKRIRQIDEILKKDLEKDNEALWDSDDNMESHEFAREEVLDYL